MDEPGESTIDGVDVEGIRTYLAQKPVAFAVLFGSRARGTADASSDVDVAVHFSNELGAHDRFRLCNRIDAVLQEYADGFVDVSDVESLPTRVAYTTLPDGVRLVGDQRDVDAYTAQVETEYETSATAREEADEELIERLASGDV
jgi:predicted nucleotidyltransferase